MLARLIDFSLRQSSLVVVAGGIVLLLAELKVKEMPVDVLPELNAPTVVIITEAGGLAADEVETQRYVPQRNVRQQPARHRRVRSAWAISLSIVWGQFGRGTDIYRARQLVSERLSAVRDSLPPGAHAEITPVTSITGQIMLQALSAGRLRQPAGDALLRGV